VYDTHEDYSWIDVRLGIREPVDAVQIRAHARKREYSFEEAEAMFQQVELSLQESIALWLMIGGNFYCKYVSYPSLFDCC
jgi:hypothetical protein